MTSFGEGAASIEEVGSKRMVDEYVVPLLRMLDMRPGRAVLLSDGCGTGADVERLRWHGYEAWGGDPGARSHFWASKPRAQYLAHFDGTRLPFASAAFDFVLSEGVIEHVGLSGDVNVGEQVRDRARLERERTQYCQEILRVLRPGGYALIGGPNRLFPVDFFHGGTPFLGLDIHLHSPLDPFLASAADVRRWFGVAECHITPLSLRKFFNTTVVANRGTVGKTVSLLWAALLAVMPCSVVAAVGPYFVLLVRKGAHSNRDAAA
jgi:SAM-dependent methyltransferase